MLEPYLKPVLSKHRGVALGVWGEAGVGKSYYITHLLKNLPCATLSVHSKVNLSTLVGQLPTPKKLPLWVSKTLEKTSQGESVENSNLISALGASLAALAPFVLHLEDIHEADPERLVFLTDLAQSIKKLKGVCLLVSSRQLPSEPFMAVKLESLTKEASDKLLEQELSATLPEESLQFIFSKAAGNPLFTLEYLRFLSRQGNLWNDGKSWYWRKPEQDRMPVVVEALLEQLIEQAKKIPMHRYILESKALLPLEASSELWQKVARVNEDELTATIQELSRKGIFKDDGFAHPLFCEVTLKTISPERKHHLSRRAVSALQDDPVQAVWFMDDAKLENEKNLELLKGAAREARKVNAARAAQFLARAVRFATGEQKGQAALEAARAMAVYDVAEAALLAETASLYSSSVEAFQLWSKLLAKAHHIDKAIGAAKHLEQTKQEQHLWVIYLYSWAGEHVQAVALWRHFTEIYGASSRDLPALCQQDFYIVAHSLSTAGYFQEAFGLAKQRLAIETAQSAKAQLEFMCGVANSFLCDYKEAQQYLQQALTHFRLGYDADAAKTLHRLALSAYYQADFEGAKAWLHEAQQTLQKAPGRELLQVNILLATIAVEQCHYELAEQTMLECRRLLVLQPLSDELVDLEIRFCYLYRSWKTAYSSVLVRKYAYNAHGWASELGSQRLLISSSYQVARAEIFCGNPQGGLAWAEKALQQAQQLPFPIIEAYSHHAIAQAQQALGQRDQVLYHLEKSINLFRDKALHLEANFYALELACLKGDLVEAWRLRDWLQERGLSNMLREDFLSVLAEPKLAVATEQEPEFARLEVLGAMRFVQGSSYESVCGRKRQELLSLLLEAKLSGRSEVNRLELLDLLYPDQDELKASSNLRALVNSLRELMGASALITTASGYALGNVPSDAEQFLKTGETSLWRGVYLQGLGIEGQETVSESLYLTLFERAKGLLETDPKEVARVGKMLLEVDPYNRDYLTLCLGALRANNNHKSLTRLYHESAERFTEVGEQLPESWQKFLG
jgi:hypothetical protein